MIIDNGLIIFLGLLFLFVKLKPGTALRLVGKPLALDIMVSVLAYALHWGTFSGVMAAAVAGMITSAFTSAYRWLFGYIDGKTYYRGVIDWCHKLEGVTCLNHENGVVRTS